MATPLQKRKLMGEINVVPMIDVMLVLLVVFMVTAPLLTQGIEVDLPKANAKPIETVPDHDPIVVSVDTAGNVYINMGDDEDKPTSGAEIERRVSIILGEKPETPVFVKADRAVEYGHVIGAMVLLQQSGAESIGFITDPLDTYPVP